MSFFGLPTLPKDQFEFNHTKFFLNYDRKEKITEWNYHGPDGQVEELEEAGNIIIGLSLQEAFDKSAMFKGLSHAIYWQLGRLVGYWQQSHVDQFQNDLICRCFGVTRSDILKSVIEKSKTSLNDIGADTKAGLGCGQCHHDISKTVQDYCDKNSFVVTNKTKPLGLNPIAFLIKLNALLIQWNESQSHKLDLELLGIKDYTIYANWPSSQDVFIKSFNQTVIEECGIKLQWEKI